MTCFKLSKSWMIATWSFPSSYLSIPHTREIIYIQIIAKSGRTTAMKQLLFKQIAEQIEQTTQHSSDDIVITLVENSESDWSFGRGLAQLVV